MNDTFIRDATKQNEYKARLEAESISIYGVKKCYASHKQYRGLIASHIKPYKLCVLENDTESMFDINNGLLLAKHIDDYFDKFLITFDNNGRIICSTEIPDEIKDEFESYKLDEVVFNEIRKRFMQIHRSLFYYKHFYGTSRLGYANLEIDKISIPFYDCGIRFYKDTFIIQNNNVWSVCPSFKLKQVFIERTKYKFKYYISNADLANLLLRTNGYSIPNDLRKNVLHCPSYSVELNEEKRRIDDNAFKVSCTNFNIEEGTPDRFLDLLGEVLNYNETSILNLRKVLHIALLGNGYERAIVFHGDSSSIDTVISIIQQVLGTYFYYCQDEKILYKPQKYNGIPNCTALFFRSTKAIIDNEILSHIISGTLFPLTPLNIDKYSTFIKIEKPLKTEIANTLGIRCYKLTKSIDPKRIAMMEGGKILNWIISEIPSAPNSADITDSDIPMPNSTLSIDNGCRNVVKGLQMLLIEFLPRNFMIIT